MAREPQDAPHAGLPQEPAAHVNHATGRSRPGRSRERVCDQKSPDSVFEAVDTDPTAPSVPVSAEMTLPQRAKGASVM